MISKTDIEYQLSKILLVQKEWDSFPLLACITKNTYPTFLAFYPKGTFFFVQGKLWQFVCSYYDKYYIVSFIFDLWPTKLTIFIFWPLTEYIFAKRMVSESWILFRNFQSYVHSITFITLILFNSIVSRFFLFVQHHNIDACIYIAKTIFVHSLRIDRTVGAYGIAETKSEYVLQIVIQSLVIFQKGKIFTFSHAVDKYVHSFPKLMKYNTSCDFIGIKYFLILI